MLFNCLKMPWRQEHNKTETGCRAPAFGCMHCTDHSSRRWPFACVFRLTYITAFMAFRDSSLPFTLMSGRPHSTTCALLTRRCYVPPSSNVLSIKVHCVCDIWENMKNREKNFMFYSFVASTQDVLLG